MTSSDLRERVAREGGTPGAKTIDRFFGFVYPEPNTGCWLWCGPSAGGKGYGMFSANGRSVRAHRFSYDVFVGPIPPGMLVCHRCDVRPCVNPEHLFLGSAIDNNADMTRKGRRAVGERCHKAKLKPSQVLEILQSDERPVVLAQRYGVDGATIRRLLRGESWAHLYAAPPSGEPGSTR